MNAALGDIRFASFDAGDLEAILAIERAGFGAPWNARQFVDETRIPFSQFVVARTAADPPAVAGYVIWRLVLDEIQIFNLGVDPRHKRCGLGSALLGLALQAGQSQGATAATLEVHCRNDTAIAFYRALGFAESGRRRAYYGADADAILMEKTLVGCG